MRNVMKNVIPKMLEKNNYKKKHKEMIEID